MDCYFFSLLSFTMYFLRFSNSYTTVEQYHNRCSKCPPCSVTHNASLLITDPRMREQGVLGQMFVRIFLFCPWNTYLNYGLFFRNTLYSTTKHFIFKNALLDAAETKIHISFKYVYYRSYRAPCSALLFVLPTAVHCIVFLLSHIGSYFYAFRCLLTPSCGASIQLWFLYHTSDM
jgi:hypothetical protein